MSCRPHGTRFLPAAFLSVPLLLSGCANESNKEDVKIAEDAIGVRPNKETKKTIETERDMTVIHDTKVIDNKSGEVVKETTTSTPVKIRQEKTEKTDVKVNVGDERKNVK